MVAMERLAIVYIKIKNFRRAVEVLFVALDVNENNGTLWYLLGRTYMLTNQYSEALQAYEKAVNLNPSIEKASAPILSAVSK